jgi:ferredoxin-NADP reductase
MSSSPIEVEVVRVEHLSTTTCALDLLRVDRPTFVFGGGQYIILNTGLVLPEGKAVKRAYSLMPVKGAGDRARITVKRIAGGLGSAFLHQVSVGQRFSCSGPWGKLLPEGALPPATLVVATDTGITTALGLVERGGTAEGPAEVLWLRSADEAFLDVDSVRRRCEAAFARLVLAEIPPARTPERCPAAWSLIDGRVRELSPELILGAGDGAVIHPLRTRWGTTDASSPARLRDVRVECFFNNPERKAP